MRRSSSSNRTIEERQAEAEEPTPQRRREWARQAEAEEAAAVVV